VIRTLATRLARAEAALEEGPGGMYPIYPETELVELLERMGWRTDPAGMQVAKTELHHDPDSEVRAAWLAGLGLPSAGRRRARSSRPGR
jgi:hypothetical protein